MSNFLVKASKVFTGTLFAQLIPLAASIVIARSIAPDEYGIFAFWMAGVLISAVFVTLRLEHALGLEEPGVDRENLTSLIISCAGSISLILCLLAAFLYSFFQNEINYHGLYLKHLLLMPLSAFFLSATQTHQVKLACDGNFGELVLLRICTAFLTSIGQIIFVLINADFDGLILGYTLGLCLTIVFVKWRSIRTQGYFYQIPYGLRTLLRRYSKFPTWSLPADLINSLSSQLPLMILGFRFGAEAAGFLALTLRMMVAPISILGGALRDVFKERASNSFRNTGQCRGDYIAVFKILLVLAIALAVGIYYFGRLFFTLLFGEAWEESANYAIYLIPMLALGMIANPLSYVMYLAEKQHVDLLWQTLLVLITCVVFLASSYPSQALCFYGLGYGFMYLIYIYLSYKFSRKH